MQPISDWGAKQLKLLATIAAASTAAGGGGALTLDSPLIVANAETSSVPLSSADLHLHDSVDALYASFVSKGSERQDCDGQASASGLEGREAFVSQLLSELTALSPLELRLLKLLDKERTKRWELQSELDSTREVVDKIRSLVLPRKSETGTGDSAPPVNAAKLPAVSKRKRGLAGAKGDDALPRAAVVGSRVEQRKVSGATLAASGDVNPLIRNPHSHGDEVVRRRASSLLTDDDVARVPPRDAAQHEASMAVTSGSVALTGSAAQMLQCEVCDADDGDFLVACSTCRAVRHEVCGGVRPDDAMMLCKACRAELKMGSDDASELRSRTTTEDHISEDSDDDDTSLSGFIVRTEDMTTTSEGSNQSFDFPTSEEEEGEPVAKDDIRSPSQVKMLGHRTSGKARAAWKGLRATANRTVEERQGDAARGRLRGADENRVSGAGLWKANDRAKPRAQPHQPQKRRRGGVAKPANLEGGRPNDPRAASATGKKRRRRF